LSIWDGEVEAVAEPATPCSRPSKGSAGVSEADARCWALETSTERGLKWGRVLSDPLGVEDELVGVVGLPVRLELDKECVRW